MNETDLHSIISASEAAAATHKTHSRLDRAFGVVVGLCVLAGIILRLAAAELIAGWVAGVVIGVIICIVGVLYGYGLRHTGAGCLNEE